MIWVWPGFFVVEKFATFLRAQLPDLETNLPSSVKIEAEEFRGAKLKFFFTIQALAKKQYNL